MSSVAELKKKFADQTSSAEVEDPTQEQQVKQNSFEKLRARFQTDTNVENQATSNQDDADSRRRTSSAVSEKIARMKQKQMESGAPLPIGVKPAVTRKRTQPLTETKEPTQTRSGMRSMAKYDVCDVCACPVFIKHPLKDICKDCDHPHPQIYRPKKTKTTSQPPIIQFGPPPASLLKKRKQETFNPKNEFPPDDMKYEEPRRPGELQHATLSRPRAPKKRHIRRTSRTLKKMAKTTELKTQDFDEDPAGHEEKTPKKVVIEEHESDYSVSLDEVENQLVEEPLEKESPMAHETPAAISEPTLKVADSGSTLTRKARRNGKQTRENEVEHKDAIKEENSSPKSKKRAESMSFTSKVVIAVALVTAGAALIHKLMYRS